MSSHTPGPWRVGRKVGRTLYCEEPGTEGRLIGVMDRPEDAALTAAAPELLASLKELVTTIDALGTQGGTKMERARAAIAKAEGKTEDFERWGIDKLLDKAAEE